MALPPLPDKDIIGLPYSFRQWLRQLQASIVSGGGAIPWGSVSKAGSNLTDLATRNHNDLQNIFGGAAADYYHLKATQQGLFTSGTTNQVLHGSASLPTWSAVVEADITLADNTTNDVSTTKHGLTPKLSNVSTEYLSGTGVYSTPAGGAGGGGTTIASGNCNSGATVAITSIPATYAYLILQLSGVSIDTANRRPIVQVSVDNGSNYDSTAGNYNGRQIQATTIIVTTLASLHEGGNQTDAAGTTDITIVMKGYQGGVYMEYNTCGSESAILNGRRTFGNYIGSTSAINALKILINGTGSFDGSGTYILKGYN